MKRITDRSFRYTPAASTNIRLTFARIRRDLKREQEERAEKVKPLIRAKSKES